MIIPILSKNVSKIELVKRAKVRRAKLYYIRNLTAKQSRMKYKDIADFIPEEKGEVAAEASVSEQAEVKTEETKTEK